MFYVAIVNSIFSPITTSNWFWQEHKQVTEYNILISKPASFLTLSPFQISSQSPRAEFGRTQNSPGTGRESQKERRFCSEKTVQRPKWFAGPPGALGVVCTCKFIFGPSFSWPPSHRRAFGISDSGNQPRGQPDTQTRSLPRCVTVGKSPALWVDSPPAWNPIAWRTAASRPPHACTQVRRQWRERALGLGSWAGWAWVWVPTPLRKCVEGPSFCRGRLPACSPRSRPRWRYEGGMWLGGRDPVHSCRSQTHTHPWSFPQRRLLWLLPPLLPPPPPHSFHSPFPSGTSEVSFQAVYDGWVTSCMTGLGLHTGWPEAQHVNFGRVVVWAGSGSWLISWLFPPVGGSDSRLEMAPMLRHLQVSSPRPVSYLENFYSPVRTQPPGCPTVSCQRHSRHMWPCKLSKGLCMPPSLKPHSHPSSSPIHIRGNWDRE